MHIEKPQALRACISEHNNGFTGHDWRTYPRKFYSMYRNYHKSALHASKHYTCFNAAAAVVSGILSMRSNSGMGLPRNPKKLRYGTHQKP